MKRSAYKAKEAHPKQARELAIRRVPSALIPPPSKKKAAMGLAKAEIKNPRGIKIKKAPRRVLKKVSRTSAPGSPVLLIMEGNTAKRTVWLRSAIGTVLRVCEILTAEMVPSHIAEPKRFKIKIGTCCKDQTTAMGSKRTKRHAGGPKLKKSRAGKISGWRESDRTWTKKETTAPATQAQAAA